MSSTGSIPGNVLVTVYEASRIKDAAVVGKQNTYVKVKHQGKKSRSGAVLGGTAPRWSESESNVLTMSVDDISTSVSVEIWRESKNLRNTKIGAVKVPVEPYARNKDPPTPRWHKLNNQGSLLFSVAFEPTPEVKDAFLNITSRPPRKRCDSTITYKEIVYHDANDKDELHYGDEITMHALGNRWMKFGSCLRSHIQKSKKCLQLTQTFDENVVFIIAGDENGTKLLYGKKFNLIEKKSGKKVMVGLGSFVFVPVSNDKKINEDAVGFEDSVYLQANYARVGGELLGCEGESKHVFDPTIYIGPHSPKVAFTIAYSDGLNKAPKQPPTKNLSLKLTTYNVWMMPDKITKFADVSPKKCERAELIPEALPESDVVVFNEAFCHEARPILLQSMKEKGFYFETPVVGHLVGKAQTKFLDGGVVVVSKYPIIECDVMRFGGVCHGDDALADKGVVYACIKKEGRLIHVFASHTQAWTYEKAVKIRQDQFRMIRNFVDEKDIHPNEPVIIAGDFNVNQLLDNENHEYTDMVRILECDAPETHPEQTTTASFDADHNPLASDGPSSDGVCERLDFILSCKHHKQPTKAFVKINPIHAKIPWTWGKKGEFTDLSDHYPCTSHFEFSYDS